MTDYHQAISELHLWRSGSPTRGAIVVVHPNRVELNITQSPDAWIIRTRADDGGYHILARIPKVSPCKGLAAVVADTQRVAGVDVRAQLDRVLLEIQAWSLTRPGTANQIILTRDAREALFYIGPTVRTVCHGLPEDLSQRLQALKHVLYPETRNGMLVNTSKIWLDMPQTAHAKMALRARAA